MNVQEPEVTFIPDRPRDSQASDSDSDGPILYRDEEEEEEEEDEYTTSMGMDFQMFIALLLRKIFSGHV